MVDTIAIGPNLIYNPLADLAFPRSAYGDVRETVRGRRRTLVSMAVTAREASDGRRLVQYDGQAFELTPSPL
ncbi:hypothetical protein Acsp03_17930 [Actinomadura sp. NBRC 104412]|nr:hypothetical protein Acsp03_17930 [Actinomadura sp. NBRC 104412]